MNFETAAIHVGQTPGSATVFATGMSAITVVISTLSTGDLVIADFDQALD